MQAMSKVLTLGTLNCSKRYIIASKSNPAGIGMAETGQPFTSRLLEPHLRDP